MSRPAQFHRVPLLLAASIAATAAAAAGPFFFGTEGEATPSPRASFPAASRSRSWSPPPHSSMRKARRKLRVARGFRPRRR